MTTAAIYYSVPFILHISDLLVISAESRLCRRLHINYVSNIRCRHRQNYEAWNNIAHAYIRLGQKDRAWKTLQEALRFSFDNWKIWDNFLVVSMDVGEFEEVRGFFRRSLPLAFG